ncbi:hypothetical protein RGQ29_023060 [Quercus rubra]|uniref:Protein ECERIFERUM 26-like n=1 Tax=Quercus rubra TaxID=3512 RepID=A0AAN7IQ66_QUERU|nr:hypothetical protein RGQ29_023060 [Quercus rubra]
MALPKEENLVYGIKLSSIGPGRSTGSDAVHDLSNMDLAMKLHYLKVVYFFNSHAAQGLTILRMKETMFDWLNEYYYTSGRLRRLESGRPYIKCNDCGARFIEARCDKTIDEFLEMKDSSLQNLLVSQQVIGPELSFSPLVLIQVTRFKCGGMSLGLSWAHILGDAFSASEFINRWGQIVSGIWLNKTPNFPKSGTKTDCERSKNLPLSVKQVDPVGDHWITSNSYKMDTFWFTISASQLATIRAEISGENQFDQIPIFETLCAIIWKCVVKVREQAPPKIVTMCKSDPRKPASGNLGNTQIISTVEAGFSITKETGPKELATLLINQAVDERSQIEELVERDHGVSDFIVYGAKLTFVDSEEANFYGLELDGHKPDFVYQSIQGVGDEGVVFVLPEPKDSCKNKNDHGRIVTIIFPENQMAELRSELVKNGLLLDGNLA